MPNVSLPPFQMTDQEIDQALKYPVENPIRLEAKIMPDVKRPNDLRRIVAGGAILWQDNGDRSMSKLIQHLLYLYFTGQLQVGNSTGYASRYNDTPALMADDDDDDIELDFDFKDG